MEKESKPNLPIADAVDSFLHSVRDIEGAAKIFKPLGHEILQKRWKETTSLLDQIVEEIDDKDDQVRLSAQVQFDQQFNRLERLKNTRLPYQLEKSLFIGLFSSYDAFIGDLIKGIVAKRPELLNKIGKKIDLSEIISAESIEDLKSSALDQYIEDFRRASYSDQFSSLESFFGLSTLTSFKSYPDFIEASQRRHLFTHCNGDVSQQYLDVCLSNGYQHQNAVQRGDRLEIGSEYFLRVCGVLYEVGLKLSHTLWRKVFPDEIEDADTHLSDTIYELLQNERWDRAIEAGEFAFKQKNHSSRERQKIITVNYCIALKFGEHNSASQKILEQEDWSDAMEDFQLAKCVLLEDFDTASEIMRKIGREGKMVTERNYHTWPLFREFRGSDTFRKAYLEIYGKEFTEEIKKGAKEAQEDELESSNQLAEQGESGNYEAAPHRATS